MKQHQTLSQQVTVAPGKPYERRQAVSSRILRVLAAEGRIRRGRPTGTFNSNQFRWTLSPLASRLSPLAETAQTWETGAAKAELARRYLAAFGPAGTEDLKWWAGWTLTDTRKAIAATRAEPVGLDDGSTGCLLPEDLEPVTTPEPWVALLPGLDPTAMGWRQRDFHLDPARVGELYDRNGNIGPTIWADGRITGAWAQHCSGRINTHLLTDPGPAARRSVESRAQHLAAWLGDLRLTPHYRTPLERHLSIAP